MTIKTLMWTTWSQRFPIAHGNLIKWFDKVTSQQSTQTSYNINIRRQMLVTWDWSYSLHEFSLQSTSHFLYFIHFFLPTVFFTLLHLYGTDLAFWMGFGRRVGCKYRVEPPSMDSLCLLESSNKKNLCLLARISLIIGAKLRNQAKTCSHKDVLTFRMRCWSFLR